MENNYNYEDLGHKNNRDEELELQRRIEEKMMAKNVKQAKQKERFNKFGKIACAAVLFGTISGASFFGVTELGERLFHKDTEVTTKNVEATMVTSTSSEVQSDVATIAKNVMPSIVSITNMSVQEIQNYFGGNQVIENTSAGSGIIIDKTEDELLILTNNHVIEGTTTLTVTFSNEDSVEAQVKGANAAKDLAVISIKLENIKEETLNSMKIATLGNSDDLNAGEQVVAIGNALGYGQSVTTGVVSATGREIDLIDSTLIQTDAAINPGNSGGALLNMKGEVIGINTAKLGDTEIEGIGYAIPISEASETINALMTLVTRDKVAEEDRGYIGVGIQSVTTEFSEMYQMPMGAYVLEVIEGGAAQAAGMPKGCIITNLNGTEITSRESLQETLTYYAIGEEVDVTIQVQDETGEYKESVVKVKLQGASN